MPRPKAVICGSFRKDPPGLGRMFRELEATGCRVLSPLSIDFADDQSEFVTSAEDDGYSVYELERLHLRAIREADFIMLHSPAGYVGTSASFEIGFAKALGKPVFCNEELSDPMLQTQVKQAASIFEVLETIS